MSGSGLMNILVCGLGLIGASLAKTLKKNTKHHIMGWNRTDSVSKRALSDGVIDEIGQLEDLMPKADVTIVNFYPEAIAPFIKEHKALFKKNSIVTDSCGIKTKICRELEKEDFDFYFVGAHPMAGREVSGYDNSLDNLFLYPDWKHSTLYIRCTRRSCARNGFCTYCCYNSGASR